MESAGRFLRRRSIRVKLLFSFVAVMLLPLLTLGIIGPIISARTIERETINHTVQLIGQVNKNIEFYIRKMEGAISILARSPDVEAFFGFQGSGRMSALQEAGARRLLAAISASSPEIAGVLLASEREGWLSNEMQPVTRDTLRAEEWYKEAVRSPGASARLIPRPIGRNLRSSQESSADDIVSVVRSVVDPASGTCKGVVLIDMKLEVVKSIFKDMTIGQSGVLFIVDEHGDIVYAPVSPIVYRVRTEWLGWPSTTTVRRIGGADYQIIAQGSPETRWNTIGVFPLKEIMRQVSTTRYYSLIIAGVTVTFAFIMSVFFTSSVARPVIRLRVLMKQAEEGDLTVRFEGHREDEIGQLGKSFNAMIEEIQKLIDLVYQEQQSKREAELKTLQEQIKPHFLYNTLDTIQWMAQDHGAEDIVRIVGALTSLFRIALSKGKEMIPLRDELEHVRSYLIIQKARYEEKFDFDITVGEEVLPYMVLKLTLQPLVENAIYHGVKERRGHGRIAVQALRDDGALVLRVTDDGIGMPREKLDAIRALLEAVPAPDADGSAYGISNVNERIQLSFGRKYGLRFESAPGVGTTVEIHLPLVLAEET